MADIEATAKNDEKFFATSRVGDFELSIDATGEDGPSPDEIVVADYAACYSFAFRAGADREHDLSLGAIRTEAEASLTDDDFLESVSLTVHVEDDLDDEQVDALIELGEELCHVHQAVKEELHADIDVVPNSS